MGGSSAGQPVPGTGEVLVAEADGTPKASGQRARWLLLNGRKEANPAIGIYDDYSLRPYVTKR